MRFIAALCEAFVGGYKQPRFLLTHGPYISIQRSFAIKNRA